MSYPIPLNNLSDFNTKIVVKGALHSDDIDIPPVTNQDYNYGLNHTYYDGAWVYFQIADYTGDHATWYPVAVKFNNWYRDNYVFSNVNFIPSGGDYAGGGFGIGQVSGFHIFPIGLFEDNARNGTVLSRNAQLAMSLNAAFSPDSTPLSYTLAPNADQNGNNGSSREPAYQIVSHVYAQKAGQSPRTARLKDLVDQALSHIQQWFVLQTSSYIRTFMVSLTLHGLATYDDNTATLGLVNRNAEIYNAFKIAGTYLKNNLWIENDLAFKYTDRITDGGPSDILAAPDLNNLIGWIYGWLYHQDGDTNWITFGDKVFKGAVVGAGSAGNPSGSFLDGFTKQFNQFCRSTFRYLREREMDPLTVPQQPGDNPPVEVSVAITTHDLILPISNETLADHFANNGWTSYQDQVDAGFPLLGEPTPPSAQFGIVKDLGALITGAATISWDFNVSTLDKPIVLTVTMSTSPDNSTWTDFSPGENPIFAANVRYVKLFFEALAATGRCLALIPGMRLRLTLKEIRDGGSADLLNTDSHPSPIDGTTIAGKWVTFNKQFADIKSLTATARYLGTTIEVYTVKYDVPNPTGFAIIAFDRATGARASGTADWKAQGY